jgi:hypothetical protein
MHIQDLERCEIPERTWERRFTAPCSAGESERELSEALLPGSESPKDFFHVERIPVRYAPSVLVDEKLGKVGPYRAQQMPETVGIAAPVEEDQFR